MTTIVNIEIDGIYLLCEIELNQEDNIDQGFELISVTLRRENIKSIIDENMICDIINEQLNVDTLDSNRRIVFRTK